jgi:hypothetical protein
MSQVHRALLIGLLTITTFVRAEEPPYKRLLQGESASKAATLEARLGKLWAAGNFTEAREPAEQPLALRRRVQGEQH